ncbi:ABC transporter ATP-binding protein [Kocuria palustris]|uniref:ABC transporter ATP-binding protein n=1 Tax=Kocuria palustris TaxID=71999 RepID=UPI0021B43EAB|nr:ATP-binding cassette domain-containing protein [Kocuria palustris]
MRSDDSLFEDPSVDPQWQGRERRSSVGPWVAEDGSGLTGTRLKPVRDPAVVIDDVTMVYRVTSTGGADEQKLSRPSRLLRRALGRPPQVDNQALTRVSLLVEQGEFVGFVGRNGSGKSTLMNIVAGQMNPTAGRVWAIDRPSKLGVSVSLVPALSGERNIRLGCLAQGMTPRQVDEAMDELIDIAALGKALHWPMKAYSSGMAARLRFAVATATNPEVLILDEALGTGDAQFQARGKARMDEIRDNAGCVLFVSHSMSEIRAMCTRLVWIDAGEVVADGPVEDVVSRYEQYMQLLADGNLLSARRFRDQAQSERIPLELINTA